MAETKSLSEVDELQQFQAQHPNQGRFFKNLKTCPVHYRPLRGTAGAHFELFDNKTIECHVSEIRPGSHNREHRHMNEAIIYILAGRGHSILHDDSGHEMRIDWAEGDLFSPPLNWWHQHFNDDLDKPARYLAFTNIGLMSKMGLFTKESASD